MLGLYWIALGFKMIVIVGWSAPMPQYEIHIFQTLHFSYHVGMSVHDILTDWLG